MNQNLFRAVVATALLMFGIADAQVPQILNYQGRVAVGGLNFPAVGGSATGKFKFALVNAAGSTTYWSNDGTSSGGGEPGAAVALTVTSGLYAVGLGDSTIPNMTAIPVAAFSNPDLHLRVWFDDGAHGSQKLSPDQTVSAVAYAVVAGTASGVVNGAIGTAQLANGAVTTNQIAAGTIAADRLSTQLAMDAITPPGSVQAYLGLTAPDGYLIADGQTIGNGASGSAHAAESYRALYDLLWNSSSNSAIIIQTNSGAASTRGATADADFDAGKRLPLPDLRGMFLRGAQGARSDGLGDPDAGSRTGGSTLASRQADGFKSHVHGPGNFSTDTAGSHVHTTPLGGNGYLTSGGTGANLSRTGSFFGGEAMQAAGSHSHNVTGGQSSATGGTETRPANIYVNYIVKF